MRTDSASASKDELLKVASRIRGIELQMWKDATDPSNAGKSEEQQEQSDSKFTRGFVIRGQKAIRYYMDLVDQSQSAIRDSSRNVDPLSKFLRFMTWLGALYGIQDVSQLVQAITALPGSHDHLGLVASAANNLLNAIWLGADLPYWLYRSADFSYSRRWSTLKELAENPPSPGSWMYDSADFKLDKRFLRETRAGAWIGDGVFRQRADDLSTISFRVLFRKAFRGTSLWIMTDRLFTVDGNGEPVLVLFIRGSEDKPKFPKRARQSVWDQVREGLKIPEPARDPGR